LTEESLRREHGQNQEDTDRISFVVDKEEKDEVEVELNKVEMEVKVAPTEKELQEVWKRYGSKWKNLQRMRRIEGFAVPSCNHEVIVCSTEIEMNAHLE